MRENTIIICYFCRSSIRLNDFGIFMNKKKITSQELAAQIAENPNISKDNAETILKLLLEGIESSLQHGKPVKIENLGTFQLEWTDIATESKGSYRIVFTPDVAAKNIESPVEKSTAEVKDENPGKSGIDASEQEEISFQKIRKPSSGAFKFKREWGLFLLFMIIPVVTLFYFLHDDFRNGFNSLLLGIPSEENLTIPSGSNVQGNEIQAFIDSLRADSIMKEEEYKRILTNIRKYEDILTEVVADEDVTLEWLSKKYYNNEIFWVYIYDANKENLTGFRRVKPGTELLIPRIPAELLDTADLQSSVIAFKLMDILLNNKEVEPLAETENASTGISEAVKVNAQKTVPEKTSSEKTALPPKRKYDKILAEETLDVGERLTYYADIYYGHRDFWVYIYEANKDAIANPQSIAVGTKVVIPDLDPDLINLNNPESLKKAKLLHNKYLGKK